MPRMTNYKNFNVQLIREKLAKAGLPVTVASRMLGYSDSSLGNTLTRGTIRKRDAEQLCKMLGLKLEDVLLQEKKEPEQTVQQPDIVAALQKQIEDEKRVLTDIMQTLHTLSETLQNFAVSTNSHLNKIHNHLKYGGRK